MKILQIKPHAKTQSISTLYFFASLRLCVFAWNFSLHSSFSFSLSRASSPSRLRFSSLTGFLGGTVSWVPHAVVVSFPIFWDEILPCEVSTSYSVPPALPVRFYSVLPDARECILYGSEIHQKRNIRKNFGSVNRFR